MEGGVRDQGEIPPKAVHMLLCGGNRDHIITIVERTSPVHIDLFTSSEMIEDTKVFATGLENEYIDIHVEAIPAFDERSISEGSATILRRYRTLLRKFSNVEILIGLTGGTNLMVAAMTLAAIVTGSRIHYITKHDSGKCKPDRILILGRIDIKSFFNSHSLKDNGCDDH